MPDHPNAVYESIKKRFMALHEEAVDAGITSVFGLSVDHKTIGATGGVPCEVSFLIHLLTADHMNHINDEANWSKGKGDDL